MNEQEWHVEYENSEHMGGGQWFEVVDSGGGRTLWRPYNCSDESLLEAKKAAHMQAASPELYKLLSEYVEAFSHATRGHRLEVLARSALAKARGDKVD